MKINYLASNKSNIEFYPVLLTFFSLKEAKYDMREAINNYFMADWTKDLLIDANSIVEQNRCCIFLDGLDELAINEEKEKALEAINSFHSQYSQIKIICSSRPSDFLFYNCEKAGFKYLEISPLGYSQIETFVSNYFGEEFTKSKRLLQSLKDSGILEKLPSTPMTIALLTILFDEKEVEIPATITDLYANFIDLLLGKFNPDTTIEILEIGAKHRLLCLIAKEMHIGNKKFIPEDALLQLIQKYADERGHKYNYDNIIVDIIENTGLLVKNSKGEVQFKHLSFQEYFTAYEIFHHSQLDRNLVINNFNNLWWQNVTIFYAGISKDAPELINAILEKSKPSTFIECVINTGGLGKLLQALYNTRISERKTGLLQSAKNMTDALNYVLTDTEDEVINFWKKFSKYGMLQILTNFFAVTHWSVTLIEPLKQIFNEQILDNDTQLGTFEKDMILHLVTTILASDDFKSFSELKKFMELRAGVIDLNILAAKDMHLQYLKNKLKQDFKENEDLVYSSRKVTQKLRQLGDISELVNTPIAENTNKKPRLKSKLKNKGPFV